MSLRTLTLSLLFLAEPVFAALAAPDPKSSAALHALFEADYRRLSLEDVVLRHALGLPVQASRETKAGGVMMIPIPRAGMLRAVSGVEEARGVPLVEGVEITARPNYPLTPLPEGDSYLGFIFARADTPQQVEAALREAHSRLRFEVADEIALEVRT